MYQLMTVGGYSEVGRNMTALRINDEAVIFDMGYYMQKLVDFEEGGGLRQKATPKQLLRIEAIPNFHYLDSWQSHIKAILLSHCHLDHIGAVPFLANRYNSPIVGTPYTVEVLKSMIKSDGFKINNEIKQINPNSGYKISENMEVEIIHMTHSTPQTAMIVIHTKKGAIIYANDFKFDNQPVLGKPANYARIREIGKEGVLALIPDSLYCGSGTKTPSETVARELLREVMLNTENTGNAIIATTFASNIARLKSIIEFGKKLDRKILFLGRSLLKYSRSAEILKLVDFSKDVEIIGYGNKIKRRLTTLKKEDRSNYLIVCTGSQGERTSVLNKILTGFYPFDLTKDDHVIFSCKTIPVEPNISNRRKMEEKLLKKRVRVFRDVHCSGHGGTEDLRDLIKMLNPQHILPSHGDPSKTMHAVPLAESMGYKLNKTIHIMKNGEKLDLI